MVMETSLGSVAKSGLSSAVSLNGSKFGGRIYYDEPATASAIGAPPPISGAGQSLSESGKKGLASPGSHRPRCQAEGCELDLSDAKLYHSKHKVCPTHSKSPKVIVRGLQCRFCQQCSRFHQLSEFDQGKRSCRRRLAGHNARRRKPPPRTFLPSCYESSSGCGGIMVDFTAYSMTRGKDSWPIPRSKECASVTRSTAPHQRLHNSENPPPSHVLVQSSAARVGFSSLANPLEGCHAGGTNSSCALSLLSSQPLDSGNKDPGMGSNGLIDAEGQPMAQLKMPYAAVVEPYSDAPWCVKGIDSCTGSLAMPSTLGNNQFSDRLGLWQQHRRQYMELDYSKDYDAATQHINWSL